MIIVGELINASRKAVGQAIEAGDADAIKQLAIDQREAGADFIDVNAGVFVEKETEYLKWLVKLVQEATDAPCCIDSPNPAAIETALAVHKGTPVINSISLEKDRYEKLIPILKDSDLKVVALCMSDDGMPETADARVDIAERLVGKLLENGVKVENIHVDPLVQPLGTNDRYAVEFLEAVERIMDKFPGVHTLCGLSNVSFGLPERKLINQIFMAMAIARGLDGAIINPLDKRMMANIIVANALAGNDNFCADLLAAFRAKKFDL